MKKFNYYYDYSPEAYNFIMQSKILRQSEKDILQDIINGKTVKELTLDRIDNEKDYTPKNCRWVTPKFQSNHKTNNVFHTFKGETKTSKQWCEQYNISQTTLNDRLKRGWTLEQALTISTKGNHKKVF